MDKQNFKKYYCPNCDEYFNELKRYGEDRCPYGERSNSSWIEWFDGCPNCEGGCEERYYCPKCEEFKPNIDFYPYADEYMCDNCYDKMMEIGELVEEKMEGVIKNEEPRGLPE